MTTNRDDSAEDILFIPGPRQNDDRRRSAPLQLENAEKLESGQVRACQIRAGQVGGGSGQVQVRAGRVRANQVRANRALVPPTLVSDFRRGVICLQVADA